MKAKQLKYLLLSMTIVLFTACGGSGSSGEVVTPTAQEAAIEKLISYAVNGGEEPSIQDYSDAGVTGVTESNLADINEVVSNLRKEEVDTPEEIQALLNDLGLSTVDTTLPVFTSKDTATVYTGQTSAITLVATDAGAVTYSIADGNSTEFDVNANTGEVIFKEAPTIVASYIPADPIELGAVFNENLTLELIYTFTATATDAAGNESTQAVTITAARYKRENEIVTDHSTGLMWQDDGDAASVKIDWQGAIDYCTNVVSLGGYTDWRLPNIGELSGIVDHTYTLPTKIVSIFENAHADYYWSSTVDADDDILAWGIYFVNGARNTNVTLHSGDDDFENYDARCVRSLKPQ